MSTPQSQTLNLISPKISLTLARDLIQYVMKLLTERGYALNTVTIREVERDLKEKLAYLVLDFDAHMQQASSSSDQPQNYDLPPGQVITPDDPRFQAPSEVFAPPVLLGLNEDGHLTELPRDAASLNSDAELRQYLSEHPVIALTFHRSYIQIMQSL